MIRRLPIIGVMGSSANIPDYDLAFEAGQIAAELGCHLLTGAGEGLMLDACRGFTVVQNRKGLSIGIVPAESDENMDPRPGYPNPYVEIAIKSHLTIGDTPTSKNSRNYINILTADIIVICAGNDGTMGELQLARRFEKPYILALRDQDSLNGKRVAELATDANIATTPETLRQFIEREYTLITGKRA